jgi:hypothetical protein
MGLLTPIIAASFGSGIAILIFLGLIILNYWATSRIIRQAGYSSAWILLPIAPLALTIICYIIFWNDIHTVLFGGTLGIGGINTVGFVWHLDQIAIFLNWLFYLIFAFSRWPVSGAPRAPSTDGPSAPDVARTNPLPSPVRPTPTTALPTARVIPSSAASPGTGPAVVPSAPVAKGAQFCAWCGESLPGNRSLFHDCGPKDRPETFCKSCGTALPAGASVCSACGVG